MLWPRMVTMRGAGTYLSDADLCLGILQSFLNNAEQGSRWDQGTIDVRLADVALDPKRVR